MPETSRSRKWLLSAAASLLFSIILFAYLNRDGCWWFWHRSEGIALMTVPLVCLTLFFASGNAGRIALAVITLAAFVAIRNERGMTEAARVHANAVGRLRTFQLALDEEKQKRSVFPESLPGLAASAADS